MRLCVAFDMSVGRDKTLIDRGGLRMSEEDWGSKAAKRFREQVTIQRQNDALLLQEETIRQEQAPRLWAIVREHVKMQCDRFNIESGSTIATFVVTQNSELQVQLAVPSGASRCLRARFKITSAADALKWSTSGHERNSEQGGEYGIEIERGKAVFQGQTPEQIAEIMLDALLLE